MSKIRRIIFLLAMAAASVSAGADEDGFAVANSSTGRTSEKTETIATTTIESQLSINFEVDGNILDSTVTTTQEPSSSASSIPSTTDISPNVTEVPREKRPDDSVWECPNITKAGVECSCDFPHTLRCTGDRTALQAISQHLKSSREGTISLLDVTVTGISTLPAHFLEDVALHGLVVSTGELRRVNERAFTALARPLQALGLPNNHLESVPIAALAHLIGLDRLDLSHNRLKTLEADSFRGLTNLTYLDLCDNLLSQLSPKAFEPLRALRSLRMRGNRLSVSALSALRGLKNLEELDLSSNLLLGPLGPNLLPPMQRLRFLTVAENEIVNVQQGALAGLRNLTYLSLSHNQIDVLEDHSFKHLSTLTRLDLANNRIVAVSSASLAHLDKLTVLDLTHNVLRSLTADLVVPLRSLQDLRLDDNDITMVGSDVPTSKLRLKRLSLSDNPLNCDCTLLEFANWLTNSSLDPEDKASAVCATPPALENGILTQVSPGSLLCGEPTPPIMTRVPLAGAQLTLKDLKYDARASSIDLSWLVEPCTERYTCDTLIIYETIGDTEIETESIPLHCDSTLMRDPCSLSVQIPPTIKLMRGHKYRYCVVLMVPMGYDEFSLGLGCSDVIVLEETNLPRLPTERDEKSSLPTEFTVGKSDLPTDLAVGKSSLPTEFAVGKTSLPTHLTVGKSSLPTDLSIDSVGKSLLPAEARNRSIVGSVLSTGSENRSVGKDRITGVRVNVSERGFLHVDVSLANVPRDSDSSECEISVAVFDGTATIRREKLNCNLTFVNMSGLILPGRYKVCASLDDDLNSDQDNWQLDLGRSRCVDVEASRRYTEIIVVAASALACLLLVAVTLLGRNLVRRARHPQIQAQCFMPAEEFEITHKAHYIKLWATTKV